MPLKGMTLARLKEHLRKTAVIYIAGIILMCLLGNIIFISTRPQTPYDREVLIYVTDPLAFTFDLEPLNESLLEAGKAADDRLSVVRFEQINYGDPESDYTAYILLMTRMSLGEGDIWLLNGEAAEYLMKTDIFLPLDEVLADTGLEPYYYTNEAGETHFAGLCLDTLPVLDDLCGLQSRGGVLAIYGQTDNLDATLAAARALIEELEAMEHAPATR
ncbi:MAG: hypothetical protein MJ099_06565 [Clostridia bacterium]|nr:hypothetical protein [Clostridia bacterium]